MREIKPPIIVCRIINYALPHSLSRRQRCSEAGRGRYAGLFGIADMRMYCTTVRCMRTPPSTCSMTGHTPQVVQSHHNRTFGPNVRCRLKCHAVNVEVRVKNPPSSRTPITQNLPVHTNEPGQFSLSQKHLTSSKARA